MNSIKRPQLNLVFHSAESLPCKKEGQLLVCSQCLYSNIKFMIIDICK